jgi:hypothetical protein
LFVFISNTQAAERLPAAEAEKLVDAHIRAATPTMNPAAKFPVKELTTDDLWKRMSIQVFQVADGVRQYETFLIRGGKEVRPLGRGLCGWGVMSLCVVDLDGDRKPALVYTYSWGMGFHRSHVAVFREKDGKIWDAVVPFAFMGDPSGLQGDLFAKRLDDGSVDIEIGRYQRQVNRWTNATRLGKLSISEKNGQLQADVAIRDDLPAELKQQVLTRIIHGSPRNRELLTR